VAHATTRLLPSPARAEGAWTTFGGPNVRSAGSRGARGGDGCPADDICLRDGYRGRGAR
jgi:hypothetical protein